MELVRTSTRWYFYCENRKFTVKWLAVYQGSIPDKGRDLPFRQLFGARLLFLQDETGRSGVGRLITHDRLVFTYGIHVGLSPLSLYAFWCGNQVQEEFYVHNLYTYL